jgi:hypothetical protein
VLRQGHNSNLPLLRTSSGVGIGFCIVPVFSDQTAFQSVNIENSELVFANLDETIGDGIAALRQFWQQLSSAGRQTRRGSQEIPAGDRKRCATLLIWPDKLHRKQSQH